MEQRKISAAAIVAIIVAVIAVVAAIITGVMVNQEKPLNTQKLQVTIVAPNYGEGATSIPVKITGETSKGESLDKVAYVGNGASEDGIDIMPGDYTIAFPASPLVPGPIFYSLPEPIEVHIGADAENEAPINLVDMVGSIDFEPIDISTVTDEQINAAVDYAKEAPTGAELAEKLGSEITAALDAAKAAAEEAARQAELKAKYHVSTQHYEFDIPEYWYDKVYWETDSKGTTTVYSNDFKECSLIFVEYDPYADAEGGDVFTALVKFKSGASMYFHNWAYMANMKSTNPKMAERYTVDQLNTLVLLQTGGARDYASCQGSNFQIEISPFLEKIADTLVVK